VSQNRAAVQKKRIDGPPRERKSWCVSETCQSYDIQNLFVVDGAAMPHLPAKNLTFTLMANAARAAEKAF
jgi:choline dehydrogenase-like flavoprotein